MEGESCIKEGFSLRAEVLEFWVLSCGFRVLSVWFLGLRVWGSISPPLIAPSPLFPTPEAGKVMEEGERV